MGRINSNCLYHEGKVLCGWYDEISNCDGSASYSIDRANLVLGMPDVERYTCRARGTQLQLPGYDLHYLREEIDRRTTMIQADQTSTCDVELVMILPLKLSVKRTRCGFRELVWELMQKDAISWLNTLSLEEPGALLERATARGSCFS